MSALDLKLYEKFKDLYLSTDWKAYMVIFNYSLQFLYEKSKFCL